MLKIILSFLIVLGLNVNTKAQLQLKSTTMTIKEYNSYSKTFTEKDSRETSNYISWKDGEIVIICTSCKTEKFVYTVTKLVSKNERNKNDLLISTYEARKLPGGEKYTVLLAYDDEDLISITFSPDDFNFIVTYSGLTNY